MRKGLRTLKLHQPRRNDIRWRLQQEFHVRVGLTSEEIKALLEVGYEFVCEKGGLMFFRKRK